MREHEAQPLETSINAFHSEFQPLTEAEIPEADVSDFSDPAGLIDLTDYVHALPATTISLTNSPGCMPADPNAETKTSASTSTGTSATAASSERNESESPRRAPRVRSMRTVRVDAWAAPASASWGRKRTTIRKVNGNRLRATSRASAARSTDWALPF